MLKYSMCVREDICLHPYKSALTLQYTLQSIQNLLCKHMNKSFTKLSASPNLKCKLLIRCKCFTNLMVSGFVRKYINARTHTHTHTHVGFYGLRGLSIGVMVFILYKLCVLLPYTYPTPKLSPHRRRCISTFPPKNLLCMIYKHFELWGH